MAEHGGVRIVREGDVVEREALAQAGDGTRTGPIDDRRTDVEEREDALRTGEALLDAQVRPHELLERIVDEDEGQQERAQVLDLARPLHDSPAAVPDDERGREAGEDVRDRDRADPARAEKETEDPLVLLAKPSRFEGLLREHLDHAIALHVLVEHRVQPPRRLLLLPTREPRVGRLIPQRQRGDGEEQHAEEGQHRIEEDGRAGARDERGRVLEDRLDRVRERVPDEGHVGRDPRHDLAGPLPVEEREVEGLQVARELVS